MSFVSVIVTPLVQDTEWERILGNLEFVMSKYHAGLLLTSLSKIYEASHSDPYS